MATKLKAIIGCMKSGKSFELISDFAPLQFTTKSYGLFQSEKNVRDTTIASRNGNSLQATKIKDLSEIIDLHKINNYEIVGIDEFHMFDPKGLSSIDWLLRNNVSVTIAGLDLDYKGIQYDIITGIFELAPCQVYIRKAVCDVCKDLNARFTQIVKNNTPVTEGLPPVVPDDGSYQYLSVCRDHFYKT